MDNLNRIITDLQVEDRRLQKALKRVRGALVVLRRLNGVAGGRTAAPRRKLSAAARRKIAEAQRARWARWKAKKAA